MNDQAIKCPSCDHTLARLTGLPGRRKLTIPQSVLYRADKVIK